MAVSNKVLAIAIVAILVVAGVAAFFLIGDDEEKQPEATGRLQVYGNVNNDDHIDSYDLSMFDKLMKDGWDEKTYPYADANRDGKLTEDDKKIVSDLVERKDCKVTYINGKGEVATADFPIKRLAIAGTMVHPVINSLEAWDKAVAKTGKSTSLDPLLDKPTYDLPQVGPKAYAIDLEELSKYNVDAVVTLYSSTYDKVETDLAGTNIDAIRINPEDSDYSLNTYLLMGFLLDAEERADIIVAFYDKYNKIIEDKVAQIKDKKTTLTMYSYSMCGTEYYLTKNTIAAGTVNLSDFTENTKKIKDNKEWAAVDKYQSDYIFEYSGWGTRWDDSTSYAEEFDYYGQYFTFFECFPQNYVVINKTMPDVARTAFVAQILYADVFGSEFGYELYQDLVDTFYTYIEDYDVKTDAVCYIDYDMVKGQSKF